MKRLTILAAGVLALIAAAAHAEQTTTIELEGRYVLEIRKMDASPAPSPSPSPTVKPSPTASATPAPTATVTPPDAPTQPAPTGYRLVPKNMSLQANGFYRSNALRADRVAYIQARLDKPVQGGETIRIVYDQRTNVVKDGKNNIKDWRDWPSATVNYENDYTGRGVGQGADQITCEDGKGSVRYQKSNPTNWTTAYFSPIQKPGVVQRIVREIRYADAGKSNGWARITIDGVVVFEADGWACHGPRGDFGPQMVYAPNAGDSGGFAADAYFEAKIVSVEVAR